MTEALQYAKEYGIPGLVILAAFWFINRLMDLHRVERREWRESAEQRGQSVEKAIDRLTDATLELVKSNNDSRRS